MSETPGASAKREAAADGGSLSAFAAKADDLDEIRKSVNDAAAVSGGLWISYLFVLFYLAIAAGAVTPVDLFLENSVKLPFLSIDLPLKAFFFLAPLLFFITHIYTLVSFAIFADKAKWYHRELRCQIAAAGADRQAAALQIQNDLRRQLVSNIFVQFLAGPTELRQGPIGFVLKLIVWTTLVFAPTALLLLIQMQFLPFHSRFITWTSRIVLLLDLGAVWWLWYRILEGRFADEQKWRRRSSWALQGLGIVVSVLVVCFSWAIATFPGEWQESRLPSLRLIPDGPKQRLSLHDYIFNRTIDPTTRRREGYFSSTLILPVFDIYEQLKIDDPAKVASRTTIFSARGRDLRDAVFDRSNLSQIDFAGADLEDASLDRVIMRNTSLYCANLHHASLYLSQLQSTWFHAADLDGAQMQDAEAQSARFEGASMKGAQLDHTRMQATTFDGADLTGASFLKASLQGASFARATSMPGVCVTKARRAAALLGANLANGNLMEANLEAATLHGAHLDKASLRAAKLAYADLSGTSLSGADLSVDTLSSRQGVLLDKPAAQAGAGATAGCAAPKDVARCESAAAARAALLAEAVEASAYPKRLARGLTELLCSGDRSARFVVRGLLSNGRIADTGAEEAAFIDTVLGAQCAIDALGADVRIDLLAAKREALRHEAH